MLMAEEANIGATLKRLRDKAGKTQQELASEAGLSMSIVALIERGKTADPKLSTLKALAKALGVSIHRLIGE